jgi:threonylcarbamoyladenosine tRNA methylthiotransferase MtaB
MKKFFIQTLGCKVNQYESDGIGSGLEKKGWQKGRKNEPCDVFIINTCSVTSKAGMQSRQAIRKIKRENPHAQVIVTGCHAQTDPDGIKKIQFNKSDHNLLSNHYSGSGGSNGLSGSDHSLISNGSTGSSGLNKHSGFHIVSHMDKTRIADNIELICKNNSPFEFKKTAFHKTDIFKGFNHVVKGSMTRAYLKIQDGCEAFCTYCIVPYARGSYVSMPQQDVLKHLEKLNDAGFKEVILTGIHTGMYGVDLKKKTTLFQLLEKINRKKPVHRIRLSSIEPGEINENIINLAAKENILCDHFHIPLQSGDDDILKKMKRPYDTDLFENVIQKIHRILPHAGIGVDTLIGFPGETDQQFENTYNLIAKLPVSYLHVFPFSPRKGTPAFSFKNQVDSGIIKERCATMRQLDKAKRDAFIKSNLNRKLKGLVQHKTDKKTDMLKAVTSNYLNIMLKEEPELRGKIVDIELDSFDRNLLKGRIKEKKIANFGS